MFTLHAAECAFFSSMASNAQLCPCFDQRWQRLHCRSSSRTHPQQFRWMALCSVFVHPTNARKTMAVETSPVASHVAPSRRWIKLPSVFVLSRTYRHLIRPVSKSWSFRPPSDKIFALPDLSRSANICGVSAKLTGTRVCDKIGPSSKRSFSKCTSDSGFNFIRAFKNRPREHACHTFLGHHTWEEDWDDC